MFGWERMDAVFFFCLKVTPTRYTVGEGEREQAAGCFHQNRSNSSAAQRSNDLTLDCGWECRD